MQLNDEGGGWRGWDEGKMRDDNTYTGDGEDLDLVTLETERQKDRETVTENSEGNQQQQQQQRRSDHHRGGQKGTELKTNWLRSKQSRYRSKYSWAEIPSVTRRPSGALYGHIWGGGVERGAVFANDGQQMAIN